MATTLLLILGIILFLGLVVIHEFGHFIAARRGGVEVEEFGIGFPPRLFRKQTKQGWLFSFNLLPLGGFVKLKGEHDTDQEAGSFGAASVATKANIMAAGVVMNLLAAYVLLVLLAVIGMPQLINDQFVVKNDAVYLEQAQKYLAVGDPVEANSPAMQAGIQSGDTIVAIGPAAHLVQLSDDPSVLPILTRQYAGQMVEVEYKKYNTGPLVHAAVTLRTVHDVQKAEIAGQKLGYLGLSVYQAQTGVSLVRSTWSAPIVAAGLVKQFTVLTFEGLGKAFAGLGRIVSGAVTGNSAARQAGQAEASSQVAGPVGIFFIFKYGSSLGYRFILMIVAILSLTLAIMNILPVPALDGGRLWLMLFTRAIRKPLNAKREEAINAIGFAFLIGVVILITIVDVKRFI